MDQIGGEVRVYGTPGEEGGQNGSAKGSFVKKGYLNDVDFALCTHPGSSPEDGLSTRNYACAPVDVEFWENQLMQQAVLKMESMRWMRKS